MEKETAEAVGRAVAENPGLVAAAFGTVMTVFGWLGNKVYRSIGHRINNNTQAISALSSVVAQKADAKVVDRVLENQAILFTQQREDRELFVGRLTKISDDMHGAHERLLAALGERPTREELAK